MFPSVAVAGAVGSERTSFQFKSLGGKTPKEAPSLRSTHVRNIVHT